MRSTIILIFAFVLTTSCFSHRAKQKTIDLSSESKRKEVSVATQWFYQLQEADSSSVVWQFRTDAPFIYHPDTGLRAQNGVLLLAMQSANWRRFVQDSNDSITYVADSQQRQQEQVTLSERRPSNRKIIWWATGLLLLIGVLYFVSKYGSRT